ncbi:MAG: hypothetical protein ACI8X5_002647 [Planctomycetota bacterium]|jgi:hypothetical protein
MDQILRWTLFVGATELVLAFGFVMILRSKHRRTTGKPQITERGPRGPLRALLVPLALLLVFLIVAQAPALSLSCASLLACIGCVLFQPHPLDQVCGELGVQVGWRSRRFSDLEEWRLTGDHLRVRIGDVWTAVSVPVANHPEVRATLEKSCPDRESRFSH